MNLDNVRWVTHRIGHRHVATLFKPAISQHMHVHEELRRKQVAYLGSTRKTTINYVICNEEVGCEGGGSSTTIP